MIIGISLYDITIFPKKWKNKFAPLQHVHLKHINGLIINKMTHINEKYRFEDWIKVNR